MPYHPTCYFVDALEGLKTCPGISEVGRECVSGCRRRHLLVARPSSSVKTVNVWLLSSSTGWLMAIDKLMNCIVKTVSLCVDADGERHGAH